MVSTKFLAELAGVSQSTVSRSLNDSPHISAKTKARICALAKEYGYAVHRHKKSTILSPDRCFIGLLTTQQPFFAELFINSVLNKLQQLLQNENYYSLQLLNFTSENKGAEKILHLAKGNLLRGLIIVNREFDELFESYLQEINIPHVYLLHCGKSMLDRVNLVDTDNYYGGYLATQHLISFGHKKIATISCPWREFEERTDGYIRALKRAKLPIDQNLIFCGNRTYDDGYHIISENIDLFSQTTAIYAQNDVIALGALNALVDHGIRVPEDVSIVGSDGYDLGAMCRPQLDSVAHPLDELTQQTINLLFSLIDNPRPKFPTKMLLRPNLILRQSVSQPRK